MSACADSCSTSASSSSASSAILPRAAGYSSSSSSGGVDQQLLQRLLDDRLAGGRVLRAVELAELPRRLLHAAMVVLQLPEDPAPRGGGGSGRGPARRHGISVG